MTRAELEQELNIGLTALYTTVTNDRGEGTNPNDIQKRVDKFLTDWSGRLTEEREVQKIEALQQAEQDHPQIVYGSTVFTERDRAALVQADAKDAHAIIDHDILNMRGRLVDSVIEIGKGNAPQLVVVPVLDVAQKQAQGQGLEAQEASKRRTAQALEEGAQEQDGQGFSFGR